MMRIPFGWGDCRPALAGLIGPDSSVDSAHPARVTHLVPPPGFGERMACMTDCALAWAYRIRFDPGPGSGDGPVLDAPRAPAGLRIFPLTRF